MLTECRLRLGNAPATGRADHFLNAAYLRLALGYHHYELNKIDTSISCVVGTPTITLPTDCFTVIAVRLRTGSTLHPILQSREVHALFGDRTTSNAKPTHYARFLNLLHFNSPPDATYNVDLYYYRTPIAPDFASASATSELAWLWDEAILESAVALGHKTVWRPDLGMADLETLSAWLARQAQPDIAEESLRDVPQRTRLGYSHGGAQ
ncbi:MAG TPA: hypothetical protein DEH78_19015 [Solibacterales bacterium]|nr:hypothetical protein [Bryobacterales bacterium]